MSTCIAFVVGLIVGGIVSFFVTACIVSETRQQDTDIFHVGYNAGFYDGTHKEGA